MSVPQICYFAKVVFIQCYGFIATPLLLKLITLLLGTTHVHRDILQGMLSAACMPPAAAAGTVLAGAGDAGRARQAHAVLAAALGVLAAAPLTTLSLLCTSGVTTLEPLMRLPARSFASVLLPLALGRILAAPLASFTTKWRWDVCSEVLLLLLFYGSCCDALDELQGPLQANDVLITVLLVLSTVCVNAALCRWLADALLPPATHGTCDVATVALVCAAHKSLAFAMPRLHILYGGGPLLTLPLLVQQPAQLLLGVVLCCYRSPINHELRPDAGLRKPLLAST